MTNTTDTTLYSRNPATGHIIEHYRYEDLKESVQKLELSALSFRRWRTSSFATRSSLLTSIASHLRARADDCAMMMTTEMGKPLEQSYAEVEKCARTCEYFAENAEAMLASESLTLEPKPIGYMRYAPLGPLLAIMPWNFPFWQVVRCMAPSIMAGNTLLVKHSPEVSGCALLLSDIITSAGAEQGLYQTLIAPTSSIPTLIEHPLLAAVTLTGSTRAGRIVAELCARSLKKSVLELGGSDPSIILDSADVDTAARLCALSRSANTGQSCIAAKRFIVHDSIYDEFSQKFVDQLRSRRLGNPQEMSTHLGPLARYDLRQTLLRQAQQTIEQGASVLLEGGDRALPTTLSAEEYHQGAYCLPIVLGDVTANMTAFDEETFGPLAVISRYKSDDEAIAFANHRVYGLGATIYVGNDDYRCVDGFVVDDVGRSGRVGRMIAELRTGVVAINDIVASDPRIPFGGMMDSGWGRELGILGIREFTVATAVYGG